MPRVSLFALAAGLGVLATFLFYGEGVGVNVPLFALVAAAARVGVGRRAGEPVRAGGAAWMGAGLVLLAFVPLRAQGALTALNIGFGTWALLLGIGLRHAAHPLGAPSRTYFYEPLLVGARAVGRPFALIRGRGRVRRKIPTTAILRGLLLASPVLVALGWLLAQADVVFRQLLIDLLTFDLPEPLLQLLYRLAFAAGAAWLSAGLLAQSGEPADAADDTPPRRLVRLPYVEALTFTAAVAGLFGLFVWIQFTYLFGGEAALAREGYTYADYAMRGTLDLGLAALLTLGVLGFVGRAFAPEAGAPLTQARNVRLAETVLIAAVLVVVASALFRLRLYEAAYGASRWRVFGLAAVVWLGLVYAWMGAGRWFGQARVSLGATATALAFAVVLVLDGLNPDAFIVRRNLDRYRATGKFDAAYAGELSSDAVPLTAALADTLRPPGRDRLLAGLTSHRAFLARRDTTTGWPSAHAAHARAARALQTARAQGR